MRPFFLIFVKCFIVYKGLSDPPQDVPPRWVLLPKAGDAEAEVSTWNVVCSRAHSKSMKELICTQSTDSWVSLADSTCSTEWSPPTTQLTPCSCEISHSHPSLSFPSWNKPPPPSNAQGWCEVMHIMHQVLICSGFLSFFPSPRLSCCKPRVGGMERGALTWGGASPPP